MGNELAKDLFKLADAIGKTFLLAGSPFTVVGVLKKKEQDSNYSGPDENKAFIPGSTFRALTGTRNIENLISKAKTSDRTPALNKDVISILAKRNRIDPADKEALAMWDT